MVAIVSRSDWGARPPKHRNYIDTPSAELWLHHTAGALDQNGNGVWWDDCQGIQRYHMDGRGWSDIAYSFLVGGGQVFEGRGVGVAGGHTKGHNTVSHAICLIGNYETMQPTQADLDAIAALMRHGRTSGWWGELTGPHRDASGASTSCCGKNLIARIPDLRRMATTPAPPAEVPSEGDDMLIIRASNNDQRLLLANGETLVAHKPLTTSDGGVKVADDVWSYLIDKARADGTFVDLRK